jgi:hypothetical protein
MTTPRGMSMLTANLHVVINMAITELSVHIEELLKTRCPELWLNQLTLHLPPLVMEACIITLLSTVMLCMLKQVVITSHMV